MRIPDADKARRPKQRGMPWQRTNSRKQRPTPKKKRPTTSPQQRKVKVSLPRARPSAPSNAGASSQVNVRNLTPLDLWVEVEGARRALRPFDQVVAMRPHDSKFKLEVNGVSLGSLLADARKHELEIRPETLSTKKEHMKCL
jgi:hypothetical protein